MGVYLWKERLPSAYQEVEYIQSSGSQYIDTGFTPDGNTELEFDFAPTSTSGYQGYFGSDYDWNNTAFQSYNDRLFSYGNQYGTSGTYFVANTRYLLEFKSGTVRLNGNTMRTVSISTFTVPHTALICAVYRKAYNGISNYGSEKVYGLKLWDSGTLVRDFVPCYRKSDDVIGMYDTVNNQFYTNSGSGTFAKGQDINYVEHGLKNVYIGIPNPTSIVLDKSSISLTTVGQTEQLTATIEPTVSDKTITWSSDDTTVATVSTTGLVTCVTPGTCTITATTVNGLTASCSVGQGWNPGVNTIAYYPLDTDFTDNSGNGYDLTGYNSATIGTLNGLSCLDLTASNSYLSGAVSGLPQGGADRTNMFWVNWTTLGGFPPYQYGQGSWNQGDVIYKNNSITWSQYGLDCSSNVRAGDGNWYYIAVTIKDGSQQIYINGELKGTSSVTVATNGTTLYLGRCAWDNTYLNGYLSNFVVEDRIRTAQEIADYYNQTKSLYGIS